MFNKKEQQNIYDPIKIFSFNGPIIFEHTPDLKKKERQHTNLSRSLKRTQEKSASLGLTYFSFLQN